MDHYYNKITISGRICTGKTTLFWSLQEKLIWPTFSVSQFFRDYARNRQLSLEKAEEQSEDLTKKVDDRVAEMLKGEGNLIVEGWMTGIMADDFSGILRIFLTCEDKVRIDRFAKREGVSYVEAEKRIKERETNLFSTLTRIYKRSDFTNLKNYNFILDTTKLSPDITLGKVLDKLVIKNYNP